MDTYYYACTAQYVVASGTSINLRSLGRPNTHKKSGEHWGTVDSIAVVVLTVYSHLDIAGPHFVPLSTTNGQTFQAPKNI